MFLPPLPQVMGILNVTPDSFSDGGLFHKKQQAYDQALLMVEQGASIIDIGGESTRPGAPEVDAEQELQRVIPVVERIRQESDVKISVDTKKTKVMREAIRAGADMINDVNALRDDGAIQVISQSTASVCLMHMQGRPETMQSAPQYQRVTDEVISFLSQRINACEAAGIDKSRIWVDPGFGFGKTQQHNYQLLNELSAFERLEVPILVGVSRKSMIGHVTGRLPQDRLAGSLGAAMIALMHGASVLRVHDVAETVDIVKVFSAMSKK